ncbi:MAG: D-alanyl-D-alanine carboxypeptidase family protein [Ruminococcus sp.]|nr:D-alanyl-D-alanine carboxypeptidase family protein [Ruminococcus sp.]
MAVKTVHHIKYKNIAIALAILLLIILAISSACSDKEPKKEPSSSVAQKDSSSVAEQNKLTKNFKYVSIKNAEAMKKGVLTLIDANNKYSGGVPADLDGVYNYLFNKNEDQIMSTSSTDVKGSQAVLEALNAMMSDFYSKTKLSNVIVNTIYYSAGADAEKTNDAAVTLDSKEHETGYAFDLNTYSADTGAYPEFTGEGKYKWIVDNCYKYGIVQRYTKAKAGVTGVKEKLNHFRYVGKPNAEIMAKKNLCLEEYLDFVKKYTFEKPFIFESDEMITYAVYYVAADKSKTTNLPIPLKENDTEYTYAYSGNNTDGYVMWVVTEDNSKLLKADSSAMAGADSSEVSSTADSSKTDDTKADDSKATVTTATTAKAVESKAETVKPAESKAEVESKADDAKKVTTKKAAVTKEADKNKSTADKKKTTKKAESAADKAKDKSSKADSKTA